MIPRYFVVAESEHELQNPTSAEKLALLGERLELGQGSRVLDMASGRGGPAVLIAREFACAMHGIEIAPEFHAAALERAARVGIADRVSFELGDAATATFEPESYDAALCLGASFVFGGLADTVDALAPAVRSGGYVAVGEPFWARLPLPDDYEDRHDPWTTLEGTVVVFETAGLPVVSVIASSKDDWDRYETLTGARSSVGSLRIRTIWTRPRLDCGTNARSARTCATGASFWAGRSSSVGSRLRARRR